MSADDAGCQEYRVDNALGASPGDRVMIEVPEGAALKAAAWAYLLPLAAILFGAIGAFVLWESDLAAALGALAGAGASYWWIRGRAPREGFLPRIAGIL